MVKNAQNFRTCGGQGGLRRFLIGNGNYLLHATFAARSKLTAQLYLRQALETLLLQPVQYDLYIPRPSLEEESVVYRN